jgi:hypothetical protein
MKQILIILTVFTLTSCYVQKSGMYKATETYTAETEEQCTAKNGYWYKGKCWVDFKEMDDRISKENIDREVEKQMKFIKQSTIKINNKAYPITFFFPEERGQEVILITTYTDANSPKTLLQKVSSKTARNLKYFITKATLIEGDIMKFSEEQMNNLKAIAEGVINVTVNDFDNLDFDFEGSVLDKNNKLHTIKYRAKDALMGAGTSTLKVKGNEAFLDGDLGTITYVQIKDLIANHPKVKTLVLGTISGSVNDAVNMHTGRLIREAGLTTKVLKNSNIASGGVDLFCSGKKRIVTKGAKIGVHSWDSGDFEGKDLPKDHPAHQYQIAYFTMCLGEKGESFYFYTLEAAPAGGIHWMNENELKQWGIGTEF